MNDERTSDPCSGEIEVSRFDPSSEPVRANPYPFYHWLRNHDPVHWGVSGDPTAPGCWYVSMYRDAVAVLKDDVRFGHEPGDVGAGECGAKLQLEESQSSRQEIARATGNWMFMRDPPAHTRLRRLVARYFTPSATRAHRGRIQAIIDALLDEVACDGCMDAVSQFGEPLSVISVAEVLGVPPEDRKRFIPWTRALSAVIEFDKSDLVMRRGLQAVQELDEYLLDLIGKRRAEPRDDLISAMVARSGAEEITDEELLGTCTQLLFGGNEPVAHMISVGLVSLLRYPEQLARWRVAPGIGKTAIEELMRYDSSVQMTFRRALVDCELQGRSIARGDLVAILFGSANRDPLEFVDPDRLDLTRRPNRHLSLGKGIHVCLGAPLARLVGQLAFESMLRKMPDISLANSRLDWAATVAVRRLTRLDVQFTWMEAEAS